MTSPGSTAETTSTSSEITRWIPGGILIILTLMAHWHTVFRDFVWDDRLYLQALEVQGAFHPFLPDLFGFVRPGKMLFFDACWALFGNQAMGWQVTALVLLCLTVTAVWLLARKLVDGKAAFIAAAIYAIHPMHVEASGWVSAINGTMMVFFGVLYLYTLLSGRTTKHHCWAVVFLVLAFFCREDAVVLPVLATVLIWGNGHRLDKQLVGAMFIHLVVLLPLVLWFRVSSTGSGQDLEQSLYGPATISFGSGRILLSHLIYYLAPLRWEYYSTFSQPVSIFLFWAVVGWVFLFAGGYLIWRFGERKYQALFLFSVIALIPLCNLIPLGNSLFGVRYLVLSGVGISLLVGLACGSLIHYWKSMALRLQIFLGVLGLSLIIFSNLWHLEWSGNERLFSRLARETGETQYLVLQSEHYLKKGDIQLAAVLSRKAVNDDPDLVSARVVFGLSLSRLGRMDLAVEQWQQGLELDPRNPELAIQLADYYDQLFSTLGDEEIRDRADFFYRIAVRSRAANGETAYLNWGVMYAASGDIQKAIEIWESGVKRFPGSEDLARNLAVAKRQK